MIEFGGTGDESGVEEIFVGLAISRWLVPGYRVQWSLSLLVRY